MLSLSKILAIIDEHRGRILKERKRHEAAKGYSRQDLDIYEAKGEQLRLLNRLKKEFALVSDADQIPLGL